ncbi:MAG: CHASE3 domain-containing protein [Thermoguttaceae bacterium]
MSIGARIGAGFAVGLVIIAAIGGSAYVSTQRLLEANRWVTHTHQIIEGLENVLSVLKDAETGQRGFILTGEDRYLEPYDAAAGQVRHGIDALVELTRDDGAQQESLRQAQKLADAKLAELQETIRLRRKSGLEAALPIIRTDRGKKIMDDLRGVVAEMQTREHRLLDARKNAANTSANYTMWTVAVWMPIALLVLAVAAVVLMRSVPFGGPAALPGAPGKKWRGIAMRYASAVVIVAIAVVLRWRLVESVGPLPLFLTFYPAVILVASIGGGGPGILATVLSALAADYWFIPPYGSFRVDNFNDALALGIFTAAGLFLSVLAERLRRSRWAEAVSATQEQQLEELSRLNEELSQQSEELSQQSEELAQQNEELSQQSEELAQQNEELQTQSEEIQTLNTELTHREDLLQKLLDAARLGTTEKAVLQEFCAAAKEMFGPAASAVIVLEPQGSRIMVHAQAGLGPEAAKVQWLPATHCFAELVIAENKTAALADALLRPDVPLVNLPGEEPFRAVLAAPMRTAGRPFGVVGVYSRQKQEWSTEQFRLAEWLAAQCTHILETLRLQTQLARLAAIVESSDNAILSKDLNGIIQTWNAGTERLFGYRAEEVVGQPFTVVVPPERIHEEEEILERVRNGQRVEHFETVRVAKDGRRIDVSVTVSPVKGPDGQILGVSKIVRDITDRKRAEDALARERANLRAVFDVVNVGMLVIREDGAVKQVNDTLSRWVKKDVAAWEGGQPGDFVGCVHALANPAGCGHGPQCASCPIRNAFASVLQTGQPVHDVETEALLSVDGSEVHLWLEVSADPLVLDGKPHVILAMNNITDRKRAEDALRRTAEDLARSNKDLEQFAYVASHDLREPLRMVTGFMSLLTDRCQGKLDAKADEYIAFACDGASRMQGLIDDLLVYSRAGRGEMAERTDVGAVLDKVLKALTVSIRESGAAITHDPLPTITANPVGLTQVLQNLIANAVTFRGERKPEIHVAARRQPGGWLFTIRDNGIGIDPQFADRIFLIFQRLHTREQYPGTGIGLAICKKVVERHGGRIWVESQAGNGSTFCFTIPDQGKEQG